MNQLDEIKQVNMLLRQKRRFLKEKAKVEKVNRILQRRGTLTIIDVEYIECLDTSIHFIDKDLKELGYK